MECWADEQSPQPRDRQHLRTRWVDPPLDIHTPWDMEESWALARESNTTPSKAYNIPPFDIMHWKSGG